MGWMRCIGGNQSTSNVDERDLFTTQDGPLFMPHYPANRENVEPMHVNAPSLTGEEKWNWIVEVRNKIKEEARPHHRRSGPPSIFRVPEHVRKNSTRLSDKSYRPLMVHIGPYHRNLSVEPRFATIQAYKWQCVRALLSRHHDQMHASKQLNLCLQWLVKAEVQAAVRECYSDELDLNAGALAQLLLADACFIIHLPLENANAKKENMLANEAATVENRFWDCLWPSKQKRKEGGGSPDESTAVENAIAKKENMAANEATTVENRFWDCLWATVQKRKEGGGSSGSRHENNGETVFIQHQRSPIVKIEVDEQESSTREERMISIDITGEDRKIQAPLIEGLWTWNLVVYDLLKLENQIPFFVIQALYDNLKTSNDKEDLSSLVLKLFHHIRPKKADNFTIHGREKFYHLLHMFYASLVPEIRQCSGREKAPERIPSVTELKRAWIRIERKEEASSFLDITYKKGFINGVIEIPKLQVYDYTESIFSNLIAFEQCFPRIEPQNAYITLYCVLMDCIIDTPEDARRLDSEGILVSRLCNQEAVADLFNKLCKDIHYKIQGSYLEDLFAEVNNAYYSPWRKQYASLKRNYFANPWSTISFGAAAFLLLLTIEQAVFAALSIGKVC